MALFMNDSYKQPINLKRNIFVDIISECVTNVLLEGLYDQGPDPIFSQSDIQRNLGKNPLFVDNGGHALSDNVRQPSTFDFNGANFHGKNHVLTPNQFMIYKMKNFGSPDITSTMNLFGKGSTGEKELRRAIDLVNGAARRSSRNVIWRTFTTDDKETQSRNSSRMLYTFWEFSLDNGKTWCILKPEPVTSVKISKTGPMD